MHSRVCHSALIGWMRLALLLAGSLVSTSQVYAQTPATSLEFEVASIKLNDPSETVGGRLELLPGGRFATTNFPLRAVILRAYDVKDYQLLGAPDWLVKDRFSIQAKAPQGSVSDAQTWLMVRRLLEDRFQLKTHRDTKELPVYALVVGKGGPKIQAAKDSLVPSGLGVGRGSITARSATIANVAIALSRLLGRPVVDETQLSGTYDFKLHYDQSSVGLPFSVQRQESDATAQPEATEPSIFTAVQEQLGLKLESTKGPVEVLVVDHVEKPSKN
jgi:uncharacterized protein (TIGR03435 family)